MYKWFSWGLRALKPARKAESRGIRSLTITVSVIYVALALLAIIFNLPHTNILTRGLQSLIGFILVEKLVAALSQNNVLNQQLVSQEIGLLANTRLFVF